jgi:hypothetical protein
MLEQVGYRAYRTDRSLNRLLREAGCDTVLNAEDLIEGMGYEMPECPTANSNVLASCDLFVDLKAHRNYPKIIKRWPRLEKRVLWYRINGGEPEHVVKGGEDYGDEVHPPCPVLTPNQWYALKTISVDFPPSWDRLTPGTSGRHEVPAPWAGRAYTCWPPFVRFDEYRRDPWEKWNGYHAPICLIHNLPGWGYQRLVEPIRALEVKMFGRGSPDGLIPHHHVRQYLSSVTALVHLKSNDAPGYALYEALAAACPIICSRRLIWRCKMQELLDPGVTCLVFDRETHDGLTNEDVAKCTAEIKGHLEWLRDPDNNRLIGEAGRLRLQQVMWRPERDAAGLKEWLERNFP